MTASQKKPAAHSASNLNGANETAAKKAIRKAEEAGAPIGSVGGDDPIDGIDLVDGDGATCSVHHSPQQARAPPSRMLRFADVIECTGLSRTTIWRRIKAGTFPAPLALGENSVGFPEHTITEWIESRPVVTYANQEANAA